LPSAFCFLPLAARRCGPPSPRSFLAGRLLCLHLPTPAQGDGEEDLARDLVDRYHAEDEGLHLAAARGVGAGEEGGETDRDAGLVDQAEPDVLLLYRSGVRHACADAG